MERAKFRQERVTNEAVTKRNEKKWLIRTGIRRFVTYLLHSQEFNVHLAGIYNKEMVHCRHTRLIAGVDAASRGKQ
ncbi:hypothetical protein Hanom_Chr08g00713451 [Helianthus anomalus]